MAFILVFSEDIPRGMRRDNYNGCYATADEAREEAVHLHDAGPLFWVDAPDGGGPFESYCVQGMRPRSVLRAQAGDTPRGLPQEFAILEFP